ncbi:hypothetical protein SAMN05216338_101338 [Bradyrhizobium sp. Rc2d]|nr:hypothetical protein SAMN05216338_101338 [Bradyrhizobium sp. Rc2d]
MSVAEFLRQRAVDVTVSGSYSLPRWYDCEGKLRSFACRTKRVSPFRMIVDVPVVGKVGRHLLLRGFRRIPVHDQRDAEVGLPDGARHDAGTARLDV